MSDETEEEEAKKIRNIAGWVQKLSVGEPIWTFEMHEIVQVGTSPEGVAWVDFVFARSPDDGDTIARLTIAPEAAQALKAALVANQNIPDTAPPKRGQRPKQ